VSSWTVGSFSFGSRQLFDLNEATGSASNIRTFDNGSFFGLTSEAIEYVEVIPEPSSLLLLTLAACTTLATRH
jgi:hypothetical protein